MNINQIKFNIGHGRFFIIVKENIINDEIYISKGIDYNNNPIYFKNQIEMKEFLLNNIDLFEFLTDGIIQHEIKDFENGNIHYLMRLEYDYFHLIIHDNYLVSYGFVDNSEDFFKELLEMNSITIK